MHVYMKGMTAQLLIPDDSCGTPPTALLDNSKA